MKINTWMLSLAVVAGGVLGIGTMQTTVHASASVRYYTNIKNQNVTVTNANAPVWTTASLKHRSGTMQNYGTTVQQYYAAHIRKRNGKTYVYYKFRVGKKTGWVWHGYLKTSATSSTTTTPNKTVNGITVTNSDKLPVEKVDWNSITGNGIFSADKTLMQLFPNTIYSDALYSTAKSYNNLDDGVDRGNYFDTDETATLAKNLGVNSSVTPVIIKASVSEPEPFTKTAIETALTKAGYDATKRAQFSGWYIGGSIEPDSWADEGAYGGMTTIILIPNK